MAVNMTAVNVNLADWTPGLDGKVRGADPDGNEGGGVPLAPSGFTASYLSDTSLSLAWIDNATNELNYELDRSLTGTGGWTALPDPAANATSATSTGLTVDTQYFYRLRAVNVSGNSAYATANGTTTAITSYSITGTGFGTKTGTPYYDNFEGEALGAVGGTPISGTLGSLVVSEVEGVSIIDTDSNSGTKSVSKDYSSGDFPKIYKALSGTNTRVYMSNHVKFSGAGGTVWKHGRVGANTPYSGTGRAVSAYTSTSGDTTPGKAPAQFSGEINNSNGLTSYWSTNTAGLNPNTIYVASKWQFYEMEFFAGTVDTSDAYFYERVDGTPTVTWENRPFLTTANSDLPDWCMTIINGHDGTNTLTMKMDDVYIDESRARVVMTNNATYSSSTKWAVQPIETYADTAVTATRKRQGFAVNDTAYLHLFDEDGVLVDSGTSFLVAEDS